MDAFIQTFACWLKAQVAQFAHEETGGGEIIATVVVIAIVIMLGVAFSSQIAEFFNQLWGQATGNAGSIGTNM